MALICVTVPRHGLSPSPIPGLLLDSFLFEWIVECNPRLRSHLQEMTRNSLRHGITINTIKSFFEQEIEARASVQEITARNAFNRLGSYSQQSISLFVGHLICVFVLLGFIGTHSICLFSFV